MIAIPRQRTLRRRAVSRRREDRAGYWFILPATVLFLAVIAFPLVYIAWMSVYAWNGLSPHKAFVGLTNYRTLFGDPLFLVSLRNNIIWMIGANAVPVVLGFLLAVAVNGKLRGASFYRIVFFLPYVLPGVAVYLVWNVIYNPLSGLFNATLGLVHLGGLQHDWLGSTDTALLSVLAAGSWQYTGFCFALFLASLQSISSDVFDAARVDGAGAWSQLTRIIVPMMRAPITVVVVLTMIGSFKVFDIVYVMTSGGPDNASQVLAGDIYSTAFLSSQIGYASAMAVGLMILVIAFALIGALITRDRGEVD